jgi:hypothetical protein
MGRRASSPARTCDTDFEVPEMEMVCDDEEISRDLAAMSVDEREEELCQLVINALFTIMWRSVTMSSKNVERYKQYFEQFYIPRNFNCSFLLQTYCMSLFK